MAPKDESPLLARLRVWSPRPRSGRGPAPAYSREQIADAAIAVAEADGLDAVTMRRVATELGTGAMSLYRYVENKEVLVELVSDRMYARHDWPELTGRWREDLRNFAWAHRRALRAHPWLLRVWNSGPTLGPNMLRHFESTVSIVDGLGLDIDDMVETVLLVLTWVGGYTRQELDTLTYLRAHSEDELERELGGHVRTVIDSGDYPYFTRFVSEARTPHIDEDARFARALDRILAGIEATLPSAGGG
ncbi:TetR family transcriptional regulator [Saccharomonospora piscinae]|uniref:TetR family transcriptional regulator n=1 Tax=Saccharomonospora piscinae TaxID=687388 RepID=A0A1V9AAG1_SACPI|nr:TetR/AcrR family transcriptional regulator C-terminal domain-containing protein [Saccharomonospora piscinae]OQO94060.1 TetR family transcriptional regulator [Saccharomonospora piscinae]TLW95234.1 TetR family transcriptional regulator [Saccharomonospora piscinae]